VDERSGPAGRPVPPLRLGPAGRPVPPLRKGCRIPRCWASAGAVPLRTTKKSPIPAARGDGPLRRLPAPAGIGESRSPTGRPRHQSGSYTPLWSPARVAATP